MNITVIGSSGFIGTHLLDRLLAEGHIVNALTRSAEKLEPFFHDVNIEIVECNLDDLDVIRDSFRYCDCLIYLALCWGDSAYNMLRNDTLSCIRIVEAACEMGVKKVIYTSSIEAIGEYRSEMDEQVQPRPLSNYGATKAATESFLFALSYTYDTLIHIVRPCYTFGNPSRSGAPIQPCKKIPEIISQINHGSSLHFIKNEGTQFLSVKNLVACYVKILTMDSTRDIFNLGSERRIFWDDIAKFYMSHSGKDVPILYQDMGWSRDGYLYDTSNAVRTFAISDPWDEITNHVMTLNNGVLPV